MEGQACSQPQFFERTREFLGTKNIFLPGGREGGRCLRYYACHKMIVAKMVFGGICGGGAKLAACFRKYGKLSQMNDMNDACLQLYRRPKLRLPSQKRSRLIGVLQSVISLCLMTMSIPATPTVTATVTLHPVMSPCCTRPLTKKTNRPLTSLSTLTVRRGI